MFEWRPSRPWWRKKRWWAIAAVWLALPLVFVGLFFTVNPLGPAIPPWKAAQLRVGMPAYEVRELLEEPESVTTWLDGGQQWVIDHGTLMGHYIEFDPNGRLVSHWEDE